MLRDSRTFHGPCFRNKGRSCRRGIFPSIANGNLDGTVTRKEFEQGVVDVQIFNPSISTSVQRLCEGWGVTEHAQHTVDRGNVDRYVQLLRQKLMTKSNRSQEEYSIREIFRNFDLNQDGRISENELHGLFSKLGVNVS